MGNWLWGMSYLSGGSTAGLPEHESGQHRGGLQTGSTVTGPEYSKWWIREMAREGRERKRRAEGWMTGMGGKQQLLQTALWVLTTKVRDKGKIYSEMNRSCLVLFQHN